MPDAALITSTPVVAMALGATVAVLRLPGPALTGALQHLTAGVVFAAAAGEIEARGRGRPRPDRGRSRRCGHAAKHFGDRAAGPVGLAATAGVDILVDGAVLGIGFAAGERQGSLLAVALTLEVLFLGLALAVELRERLRPLPAVAAVAALGLLLPLGALAGGPVSALPRFWLDAAFAFALVALLYLVIEELLVEAHEQPDTPWATAASFVGFLVLLMLEETL